MFLRFVPNMVEGIFEMHRKHCLITVAMLINILEQMQDHLEDCKEPHKKKKD